MVDLGPDSYYMPSGYWGSIIEILRRIAHVEGPRAEEAKEVRQEYYDLIREKSGLDFPDYGDDADRWLAWMRTNDTKNKAAAERLRDENLRRRAAGLEGFYDWSPIKGNY